MTNLILNTSLIMAGALGTSTLFAVPYVYQLDESFEQDSLSQSPWTIERGDDVLGNVTLQSDIFRGGHQAIRLVNNYKDPDKARERTEMVAERQGHIEWGQEYWVGFSFYLKDWIPSPLPEMVHQFHAIPHAYNWKSRSPRNLTSIYIKDDKMYLMAITKPWEGPATGGASAIPVWEAPVQSNVWNDWVIHVRPANDGSGFLEVWKNGKSIYRQDGPNADSLDGAGDPCMPRFYLKAGVYNWPWMRGKPDVTTREIYYDEIRIGHVEGGYTGGYNGVSFSNIIPADSKP